MSKAQSKKQKSRTYARNRTNLSRRGYDKFTEPDGVFLLKLLVVLIVSSVWVKFQNSNFIWNALPLGLFAALLLARVMEKRPENRKLWYVVVVIVGIMTYFLPAGIVI